MPPGLPASRCVVCLVTAIGVALGPTAWAGEGGGSSRPHLRRSWHRPSPRAPPPPALPALPPPARRRRNGPWPDGRPGRGGRGRGGRSPLWRRRTPRPPRTRCHRTRIPPRCPRSHRRPRRSPNPAGRRGCGRHRTGPPHGRYGMCRWAAESPWWGSDSLSWAFACAARTDPATARSPRTARQLSSSAAQHGGRHRAAVSLRLADAGRDAEVSACGVLDGLGTDCTPIVMPWGPTRSWPSSCRCRRGCRPPRSPVAACPGATRRVTGCG